MAITYTNIGLAEPSTITHRVSAVTIARGSTNEQQEILCIGDGQSSLGIATVTDTTPASTAYGLVVREAAQSTGPFLISSIASTVNVKAIGWASTYSFGQVTLGSTVTQIAAANAARTRLVVIQHSTAVDVYLGSSAVVSTTGLILTAVKGNQIIFKHTGAVYGISTGGSPVVSYHEESY